jgi:NADP-dependent 3-hydroxy acid dehydrogenase YdfG
MRTLKDKIIIVTGAGGTVAGAIEKALADAGARPLLVDRDGVRIQGRAASYGTAAIEEDLSTLESAERMVKAAKAHWGKVDGLIHLVGELTLGSVLESTTDDYNTAFDSNMRTLYHAVKAVLPELLNRDEAFIAGVASHGAWGGSEAGASLFAAAKSAAAAFLRSLDAELNDSNISVVIAYPMGWIDTATNRQALNGDPEGFIDPRSIADMLITAATLGSSGRLVELPIYPPRRKP